MSFTEKYAVTFRKLLPAPFTIALLLTLFTFILAIIFGDEKIFMHQNRLLKTAEIWYDGLWQTDGLAFAVQMMLMLLLGHVLALSKPINSLLNKLTSYCTTQANAAIIITFFTIVFGMINWGLGLIFGALFARKIVEQASILGKEINYGFIGACGYVGMMVWHGGLSGSAPIKVADPNHLTKLMEGVHLNSALPDAIPMSETVFSGMNISASIALITILPLSMFFLAKKIKPQKINIKSIETNSDASSVNIGMEKVDNSRLFSLFIGIAIMLFSIYKIYVSKEVTNLSFLTPNFINFSLLGLGLIMHSNIAKFLDAVEAAIGGVSGILIQFPLYYGIMAIMRDAGLMASVATWVSEISTSKTFPVLNLVSSGFLNILVPSGGGQWIVQGPIIVEASIHNGVPLAKSIMAMSYGDQLTNMMQPFWALPLLAITGLKAKEILPYTLILMVIGGLIFTSVLLIF